SDYFPGPPRCRRRARNNSRLRTRNRARLAAGAVTRPESGYLAFLCRRPEREPLYCHSFVDFSPKESTNPVARPPRAGLFFAPALEALPSARRHAARKLERRENVGWN